VTADFTALVLEEEGGKVRASVKALPVASLPEGDVSVAIAYSTLNYKDGMIVNGLGRMVRNYPHVPGIDFVGTVEESASPAFKPGDEVILTGWRVGEIHWGGYAQKARVKAAWLVPLPAGLTPVRAMAIGTAGFTAMLSLMALEEHGLHPSAGEVLVTGASGGLGSVAVALLAAQGYAVAASTGRPELHGYLRDLGAATILDRAELVPSPFLEDGKPGQPLGSERWAGAIDTVGGATLTTLIATMKYWSSIAVCGLASGSELHASLLPFLLRGVNLLGIESGTCQMPRRAQAWERLAKELPMAALDRMTAIAPLRDVPKLASEILLGRVRGRTVIDVNA